jgi:hypothetical protein
MSSEDVLAGPSSLANLFVNLERRLSRIETHDLLPRVIKNNGDLVEIYDGLQMIRACFEKCRNIDMRGNCLSNGE